MEIKFSVLVSLALLAFFMKSCASPEVPESTPRSLTIRLEGAAEPGLSFSRRYARDCPRIAKKILSCATRPEFANALLVYIGQDSKRAVQAETSRALVAWKKAGAEKTCESWSEGFYGGALLAEASALENVAAAASKDCSTFGTAIADNGGLPQLVPAR